MALAAMNQVLVLATHLDEELLGSGGTIARHADAGDQLGVAPAESFCVISHLV